MPQNVREWLPSEHLCWKVLEIVGELDLSAFEDSYRADGRGGAAYPPTSLVALLLYCYSKGVRSSRQIVVRQPPARPAAAPRPSKPGPGRPPGSKNKHRAKRHDVGKTVKRAVDEGTPSPPRINVKLSEWLVG